MGDPVTRLGFGAWAIGGKSYGPVERSVATDTVRAYLEAGGNFLDTARGYGQSESVIGEVLQEERCRDAVFLCTKAGPIDPKSLREHVFQSLRELQVDCVDLLYLHAPPDEPDLMERALDTLEGLREEGRIRGIGASIKGPDVTSRTLALHRQYLATGRIDAIQLIYSLLRPMAREIFAEAAERGVAVVARTMLESGFLTGKYPPEHRFPEGDHRRRWSSGKREALLAAGQRLASDFVLPPCRTASEVALRFALDDPGITCAIPGAKNPRQLRENLASGSGPSLPGEERARLAAAFDGLAAQANPGETG